MIRFDKVGNVYLLGIDNCIYKGSTLSSKILCNVTDFAVTLK